MNKDSANNRLIEEIKQKSTGSLIDNLVDILPFSKEAIYRRLRGEVLFSFDEAVLLAQKMNFSLDQLSARDEGPFPFETSRLVALEQPEKAYEDSLNSALSLLKKNSNSEAIMNFVGVNIPLEFTLGRNFLNKFNYYKWLYQIRKLDLIRKKFSEIILPDMFLKTAKETMEFVITFDYVYMLSDSFLDNFLKEVKHFIGLGLVERDDVISICKDLHKSIEDMEMMVTLGKRENGSNVSFYLGDIMFDSTFGFLENGNNIFSFSKIIETNYAITYNLQIYEMFRAAFFEMKDYTTLISQSGSVRRNAFFKEQHRILDYFISKYV